MDSDLSEPCAGVVVLALMGITVSANLDRGYVKEARMKALANINNLTSLEVLYEDKHERYASTLEN